MSKFRILLFVFLFCVLIYTRFVNIGWGLPYPMHPDERNMAVAVQSLHCEIQNSEFRIQNCLNPHFFAYGQFPLYLAYFGILLFHLIASINTAITFNEATIALRIISAIASVINVWVLIKIIETIRVDQNSKVKIQKSKVLASRRSGQFKNQKSYTFNFLLSSLPRPSKPLGEVGTFAFLLLTFSPYSIQFSHFGTTESLLMLFYSLIVLLSLHLISHKFQPSPLFLIPYSLFLLSLVSGLSLATKLSSAIFLIIPFFSIIISYRKKQQVAPLRPIFSGTSRGKAVIAGLTSKASATEVMKSLTESVVLFSIITFIISILLSPHNLISFKDFFSSMQYESSIALGKYVAFYTRQFVDTIPIWFQMTNIFPYTLGWPQFILSIFGFIFLSWKNKYINLLRISFLVYVIPNAFVFTKWTRFMAPIFPIMSVFAILFLYNIYEKLKAKIQKSKVLASRRSGQLKNQKFYTFNFLFSFLTFTFCLLTCVPGIAFFSIYTSSDVRFIASDWIYKNIPVNSKILSETANVVDIPIQTSNIPFGFAQGEQYPISNYQYSSFDFYNLDTDVTLQNQLNYLVQSADYIFVPSRRIFMNHQKQYSLLNDYYEKLFSGQLGFEKVAEFSSYPRIQLFGKTIIEFPDEQAEESFTVFDHPVIRIYKRIQNSESRIQNENQRNQLDFSNYQTTNYQLSTINYRLLLADSPEKWEKGLMYVRSKKDINGLDGMLFRFPTSELRTFWNKNTFSNLALYWINNEKVVGISNIPSVEKGKSITVNSPQEVNMVIEIIQ